MTRAEALIGPVLLLLAVAALIWDRARRSWPGEEVRDRPGQPYRVYTRRFDRIVHADEIPEALHRDNPDVANGWIDRTGEGWRRIIDLTRDALTKEPPASPLAAPPRLAISLLIDQSGSLRGTRMRAVAIAARQFARTVAGGGGARLQIAGFSTLGWNGSEARLAWLARGCPRRPGRLCATLHIVYKAFEDAAFSEKAWEAMLHPDLLRENVDGEAVDWAVDRLLAIDAERRLLLVVSDGAPVDDATLQENGSGYLRRDLDRAIARAERLGIALGAVGLGYDVSHLYRHARSSGDEAILADLLSLVEALGTNG